MDHATLAPPAMTTGYAAEDRPDVRAWVERLFQEGPIAHLDVWRPVPNNKPERVGAVSGIGDPDSVTAQLVLALQEDCEAIGGQHLYLVMCYRPLEDARFAGIGGQHQAQQRFLFQSRGNPNKVGLTDDKLIEQTLAGQAMRHAERFFELGVNATVELSKKNEHMLDRAMNRIRELEQDADKLRLRERELDIQAKQLNGDILKGKREDRIHELAFNTLSLAAPVVMGKLLPQSVGTPPRSGDLVQEFFLDLSPRQVAAIIQKANLDPAQLMALQSLRQAYLDGKTPSFGDETLSKLFSGFQAGQWDAIESILRKDQLEALLKILSEYQKGNGVAANAAESAPS